MTLCVTRHSGLSSPFWILPTVACKLAARSTATCPPCAGGAQYQGSPLYSTATTGVRTSSSARMPYSFPGVIFATEGTRA